jgi:hypothetical protein
MWYQAHRDVALAALGAATGLASIVLVFMGFLFATAGSFPSDTPNVTIRKYERLARIGLAPVLMCGAVMLTSFVWLFHTENIPLLKLWAWGFPVATIAFLIYATWAVYEPT